MKYQLLSIALMAMMVLSIMAMPIITAEDDTSEITDGSEENLVISPTQITLTESEDLDETENVGTLKMGWQKIGIWFTFNQEKKAERELKLARLELIRAKIATKNGDSEALKKALEAHEKIMTRVQERVAKISYASDAKSLKDSAVKLVALERAMQIHELRIAKMKEILANSDITTEQKAKLEEKIEKTETISVKLSELNDKKRETLKTKLMAVNNISEEEAEDIINNRQEKVKANIEAKFGEAEIEQEQNQGESTENQEQNQNQNQAGQGNSA